MHKNALFLLQNCKNRPALGTSPPDPLAFGGWRFAPKSSPKTSKNPDYATASTGMTDDIGGRLIILYAGFE